MIVREGLRSLLRTEPGIQVVGEAQTGRQAVDLARKLRPAVIVMDIAMPLLNGLEAARQILKDDPAARVIMLSAHSDDAYVEEALALGAAGYLIKQSSLQILSKAIREAHEGNLVLSPSVAKRVRDREPKAQDRSGRASKKVARLSSREIEVLQMIAEGRPNKQVASELGISIKTVEKHRQNLMSKLNIHDVAGLTRYAIAAGVIESSVQITIL